MHFVKVSKVWTCTNLLALRVHTILVLLSMTASGPPVTGVPRFCIAQLH